MYYVFGICIQIWFLSFSCYYLKTYVCGNTICIHCMCTLVMVRNSARISYAASAHV